MLTPNKLLAARLPVTYGPPARYNGHLHIHDSSISVWEEKVAQDECKAEVFMPLVQLLKSRGWTVTTDPHIDKHYRCLSKWHRYARLGDLEAKLSLSGRHLEFKMFQNVANVENRNGGEFDFDKLDRMPYLLRLQCLSTMAAIAEFLTERHGYFFTPKKDDWKELGPEGMTAMDYLAARYAECWHTKPELGRPDWHADYNRRSGDGTLLEHGQTVWSVGCDGRWRRGTAYYNLNSMWWVVYSPHAVTNCSCGDLHTQPPANLRAKSNDRKRRERLETLMAQAVKSMNFARADLLKRILFGPAPLYRIWSGKRDAWYRSNACGYTESTTDAGLYQEDEARRLIKGIDYLRMVPVAA